MVIKEGDESMMGLIEDKDIRKVKYHWNRQLNQQQKSTTEKGESRQLSGNYTIRKKSHSKSRGGKTPTRN